MSRNIPSIGKQLEADLEPYMNGKTATGKDLPRIKNFFYVARGKQIFMGAVAENRKELKELFPVLQQALSKIPGTFGVIIQPSIFNANIGEGRSIDVNVTGDDLDEILRRPPGACFSCPWRAFPGRR